MDRDPADDKTLTFNELHKEVCKFSNALKEQGVRKGDVVCSAAEARAAADDDLQHALHIGLLNQGYLVTPFHNMVLVAPTTTEAQIDGLIAAFGSVLTRLTEGEMTQ